MGAGGRGRIGQNVIRFKAGHHAWRSSRFYYILDYIKRSIHGNIGNIR